MRYLGGKTRFAAAISEAITQHRRPEHQRYVEPFVGAGSVLAAVVPRLSGLEVVASDASLDLMLLLQAVRAGWQPPEVVALELHRALRTAAPSALRAFVGFGCSYSGDFFAGFVGNHRRRKLHTVTQQSRSTLLKRRTAFQQATLGCWDYRETPLDELSLIYCDPPYAGTTGYRAVGSFDSITFWEWAREVSRHGHTVLVSEQVAPVGWEVVWSQECRTRIQASDAKRPRTERLFTWKGTL